MDENLLIHNYFLINVHGQIESCIFPGDDLDSIQCRCIFRNGPDWSLLNADNSTNENDVCYISQIANKVDDGKQRFVWNLPFEATFKSTNVFGWPQLIVIVYCIDNFGNDIVRGYGWIHLPTKPGSHVERIRLFAPDSATMLNRITSWFVQSRKPTFTDARLAAGNDGRSLVAVQGTGEVTVHLNLLFKDFKKFGFVSR
ncbi:B9 domain-containing protein 1 [Blomia tropicalis]|nr:B9 domain-containing protein 1 [Blomia tropicalis]